MRSATQTYSRLFEAARRKPEDQRKFWKHLKRDMANGTTSTRDFSIQELFESFVFDSHGDPCGRELWKSWKNGNNDIGQGYNLTALSEASGPVERSAFSNITGQIVYNEVMDAWNQPEYLADSLAKNVSTAFLDGERIPGISVVGDDAVVIGESQPYPYSGVSEQFVDTPAPTKIGHIVALTKESIISDRTERLVERAASVTNSLRINKEKRVLDLALGITTSWKRNGSQATATYADSGVKPHDFDNLAASNPLLDWKSVEEALLLFDGMRDPDINEPIVVVPTTMIVPTALLLSSQYLLRATTVETRTGTALGGGVTEADRVTVGVNPLRGTNLLMANNAYVSTRTGDTTTWFVGDPMKAFRYMEVWPITTVQAPTNSYDEFTRDIVQQWKVSEYGVPAVVEPRYMVKNTA